jgi:hypothetical protein
MPALGRDGEPCPTCGAPLAGDQRYCLECGARRADARLPFIEILEQRLRREGSLTGSNAGGSLPDAPPSGSLGGAGWRRPQPALMAAVGAALFVLTLGLGVLIGSLGDEGQSSGPVAAARPQVIRVSAPAATPAVARAQEFTADWPSGKTGYTVQLETLPKDGTEVAAVEAAKSAAESKGAPAVGALDSDEFGTLDSGTYVIYSGVFGGRTRAKKALKKLKRDFPQAEVVRVAPSAKGDRDALSGKKKEATVDRSQLKQLQGLSPDQYQKKARKLPDTTKLPGEAPKTDNKQPGGGSGGGTEIK